MISRHKYSQRAENRRVLYWALISAILILATSFLIVVMEVLGVNNPFWDDTRSVPLPSRANLCIDVTGNDRAYRRTPQTQEGSSDDDV